MTHRTRAGTVPSLKASRATTATAIPVPTRSADRASLGRPYPPGTGTAGAGPPRRRSAAGGPSGGVDPSTSAAGHWSVRCRPAAGRPTAALGRRLAAARRRGRRPRHRRPRPRSGRPPAGPSRSAVRSAAARLASPPRLRPGPRHLGHRGPGRLGGQGGVGRTRHRRVAWPASGPGAARCGGPVPGGPCPWAGAVRRTAPRPRSPASRRRPVPSSNPSSAVGRPHGTRPRRRPWPRRRCPPPTEPSSRASPGPPGTSPSEPGPRGRHHLDLLGDGIGRRRRVGRRHSPTGPVDAAASRSNSQGRRSTSVRSDSSSEPSATSSPANMAGSNSSSWATQSASSSRQLGARCPRPSSPVSRDSTAGTCPVGGSVQWGSSVGVAGGHGRLARGQRVDRRPPRGRPARRSGAPPAARRCRRRGGRAASATGVTGIVVPSGSSSASAPWAARR